MTLIEGARGSLPRGGSWHHGRSPGYFRANLCGPDPACHYFGKHDDRSQAEIWRAALLDGYLFATITAGEVRLAARLAAEAQCREQRRQALVAIMSGMLVVVATIVAAMI